MYLEERLNHIESLLTTLAECMTGKCSPESSAQAGTPDFADLKRMIGELHSRHVMRDWYTTAQAAEMLGVTEYTVRQWCREGRLNAKRQLSGRGLHKSWAVSLEELRRYQKEGLLPPRKSTEPAT